MYFIKQKKKHIRTFCAFFIVTAALFTTIPLEAHTVMRTFYSPWSRQSHRGKNSWNSWNGVETIHVETHTASGPNDGWGPCVRGIYRVGSQSTMYVNYCVGMGWIAADTARRNWFDGEYSMHSDRHPNTNWDEVIGNFG